MATAIGSWNAFTSERDPWINVGIKDIEPASTNIKKTSSGLRYQDRVVGSGKPVGPGQDVSIDYVGSDHKGDVFDRTYNNPYTFTLGKGEVIQGLDEGIEGMRVGGRRMLIIPADLAYGENPVVFDVQLMNASVNPGSSEDVVENDEVEQLEVDTVPKLMDSKSPSCRKAENDSEESRNSANDKSLNCSSTRKQRNYHYTFDVDDNGLDINGFIIHRNKKGHKRHKFRVYLDTNENGRFDRKDQLIGKTGLKRKYSRKGIGNLLEEGELGQLKIKFKKNRSNASMRVDEENYSKIRDTPLYQSWDGIDYDYQIGFTDSAGNAIAQMNGPSGPCSIPWEICL